jgi:pyrroline-5-carboxylate reductase
MRAILRELGDAMLVEERLMNAGMVLASCGIAYALRYIRAASEGGVQLGFRAAEAQHIVAQTLRGAASLLERPNAHPEAEIDRVTTPGGLTIRGLNAMEQAGFTNAVIRGLLAALPEKK